jgi:hypothetical protein
MFTNLPFYKVSVHKDYLRDHRDGHAQFVPAVRITSMNKELDEALVKKYPLIFADRYGDMQTTAMCWGFECGNGWYNLIDTLCAAIQGHIDYHNKGVARTKATNEAIIEYGYGNREPLLEISKNREYLVETYLKKGVVPVPNEIPQVVATQVKEKYGGLRFYYGGGDGVIDNYVRFAEMMSERTCEVCGAPGEMRGGSWVVTRCEEHA